MKGVAVAIIAWIPLMFIYRSLMDDYKLAEMAEKDRSTVMVGIAVFAAITAVGLGLFIG